MKTLIAYYSGTGKTKMAAERLQEVCGGDLIEIKGKKKYGAWQPRQSVTLSQKEPQKWGIL